MAEQSLVGQLFALPDALVDRGRAAFSPNRDPGVSGFFGAVAEPQPVLQRDAIDAVFDEDPQFLQGLNGALEQGDIPGAQRILLRKVAPLAAQGRMPEYAAPLFQQMNALRQQTLDPNSPNLGQEIVANSARMGDPRMVTAGANVWDAASAAQRRGDQTAMEQERQPALIDRDRAAAEASRAAAWAQQENARWAREKGLTEAQLRDPQVAKAWSESTKAKEEAFMASRRAAQYDEELEAAIEATRAGATADRALGAKRITDARVAQAKLPSEIDKNEADARLKGSQADFMESRPDISFDEEGRLILSRGNAQRDPAPQPTPPPTQAPGLTPGQQRAVVDAGQAQPPAAVDPQGLTSEQMLQLLGPEIALRLMRGENVTEDDVRPRLAAAGVNDRNQQSQIIQAIVNAIGQR